MGDDLCHLGLKKQNRNELCKIDVYCVIVVKNASNTLIFAHLVWLVN